MIFFTYKARFLHVEMIGHLKWTGFIYKTDDIHTKKPMIFTYKTDDLYIKKRKTYLSCADFGVSSSDSQSEAGSAVFFGSAGLFIPNFSKKKSQKKSISISKKTKKNRPTTRKKRDLAAFHAFNPADFGTVRKPVIRAIYWCHKATATPNTHPLTTVPTGTLTRRGRPAAPDRRPEVPGRPGGPRMCGLNS
jgi:hypothetical protein